jgi:hypothetical protein
VFFSLVINISLDLGIPKVKLAPPCPDEWKVFEVVWVLGSLVASASDAQTMCPGWVEGDECFENVFVFRPWYSFIIIFYIIIIFLFFKFIRNFKFIIRIIY